MMGTPQTKPATDLDSRWVYCVRRPNAQRQEDEGHTQYKKGYEVRFSVEGVQELRALRRYLKRLGLKPGRAYVKVNRLIVPVYGKQAVDLLDR